MNAQKPAFNIDGPIDHIESAKIYFLLVISGFLRHRILFLYKSISKHLFLTPDSIRLHSIALFIQWSHMIH